MSVYVTGDTHGYIDIDKLSFKNWNESKFLKESDTLIICGDFGFIWDGSQTEKWWLNWFEKKPYTTAFIPGNHDCYPLIKTYSIVDFHGGKARKINNHLYELERGEVFDFDGKKFFCMGGASSHDMWCRTEGRNWWKEELPNDEEYKNAEENLKKNNYSVDYIITHCGSDYIQDRVGKGFYEHDKLTNFFEQEVRKEVSFKEWFMGHYHEDTEIYDFDGKKHRILYNDIIKVI